MINAFIQHSKPNSDKMVLQALVPFVDLMKHALFTSKANPNEYLADKYDKLAEENLEYYQRRINSDRLKDIQKFIITAILEEQSNVSLATLFPSSMIIALSPDYYIPNEGESVSININKNVFIVDGQHRLMAMILLYKRLISDGTKKSSKTDYIIKYLKDYKFNCTILVNFDLWEQGQVFINVNFKQKPVNKSLYYEVFGSEYREGSPDDKRNQIYLAHCLVKDLNEQIGSPFYNKIKMLGTGSGYVSQAFFVEAILPLFRIKGIWWKNPINYEIRDDDYNEYLAELITYFKAIKDSFNDYWPTENESNGRIICKTTSIGAFLRLLSYIRNEKEENFSSLLKSTPKGENCKEYYYYMLKMLSPIKTEAKKLFGDNSEFSSGSGKGFESRLFKRLRDILIIYRKGEITQVISDNKSVLSENNITIDSVREDLLTYYWDNEDDELSSLCHHYDFVEIDNIDLLSAEKINNTIECKASFTSYVTFYIDNEDERGFPQYFPCVATFTLENNKGKWGICEKSVRSIFDTTSY